MVKIIEGLNRKIENSLLIDKEGIESYIYPNNSLIVEEYIA